MKKEIKTMLQAEEARYDINGVFSLRYNKHDIFGTKVDALKLEFNPSGGGRYHKSAYIQSRTDDEIVHEITLIMAQMLNTYTEDMIRSVRGGNWGRMNIVEEDK